MYINGKFQGCSFKMDELWSLYVLCVFFTFAIEKIKIYKNIFFKLITNNGMYLHDKFQHSKSKTTILWSLYTLCVS